MVLKYILMGCFLFTISVSGFSSSYYVTIAGNDNNAGTEQLPWLTIEKATEVLIAGDTVFVKEGTYEVGGTNTRFIPALNPTNSGTIGDPIVFKNYCNDIVKLVQNDFGGPLIGSYQKDYIIWDGFIIHEATTYAEFIETEHNICVICSTIACSIINCEIIGELNTITSDNHIGIRVEDSVDTHVRNCRIHEVQNQTGSSHGYGIENWYSDSTNQNLLVENCEIYNCGVGIGNHEGGVNNIYRKNYIHDCTDRGIGFGTQNQSTTTGAKIYQNLFINIGDESIVLTPPEDTEITNFEIYNNTIFTTTGTDVGEITSSYNPNLSIWNNIIFQQGTNPRLVTERYVDASQFGYMDYNNYDIDGEFVLGLYSNNPTVYNSLSDWSAATMNDINSQIADPLFVSIGANDFRLATGSPCLLAGIDRQDHNGNGDTAESINMGAYILETDTIGVYNSFNHNCLDVNTTEVQFTSPYKVYPNPTDGVLNITGKDISQVKVFNAFGLLCHHFNIANRERVDISQLPQGIYSLCIYANQKVIWKTIIKL